MTYRCRWAALALAAALPCLLFSGPSAEAQQSPRRGAALELQTTPRMPGLRFSLGARTVESDRRGRVRVRATDVRGLARRLKVLDADVSTGVRAKLSRVEPGTPPRVVLDLYYRIRPRFVDPAGEPVDPGRIASVTLRGSHGVVKTFKGDEWPMLQGTRAVRSARESEKLAYVVESVVVDGSNVVNRAQQRFLPSQSRTVQIELMFYPTRFVARDALLGFPIGSGIRLQSPDGDTKRHAFRSRADLTIPSLPRGRYRVTVEAPGISPSRPVALSRAQQVDLKVISYLDVAVVLLLATGLALGLPSLRRPLLLSALFSRRRRSRSRARAGTWMGGVVFALCAGFAPAQPAHAAPPGKEPVRTLAARAGERVPLLAYYYIWFNVSSWNRAKTDYPLLGRYSSDERRVMRRHIRRAKEAGIDGFIVSWKSTTLLNRRLEKLIEVADAERFKLVIIYQGLDFDREPLPAQRVAADLDAFLDDYAQADAFAGFGRPVVIWSGTWRFSQRDVADVSRPRRERLRILASEKNIEGYRRLADVVDGNAYYWSSVDPYTHPNYPRKLVEMGEAVNADGGLWIAPAAPGFDARLVGGTKVIDRRDGATLRKQLDGARRSAPDAIGLISWNEFSENSHVEPSRNYGRRYLEVLAAIRGTKLSAAAALDSSEPATTPTDADASYSASLVAGFAILIGVALTATVRRVRRSKRAPPAA